MYCIKAGFACCECVNKNVVYINRDISNGMKLCIAHATELSHPIEYRTLGGELAQ
jgi:hypothetical protein